MRSTTIAVIVFTALTGLAWAEEDVAADRPAFSPVLRQNEDWSGYRPGPDAPLHSRIKHLDLTDAGDLWLSVGGEARLRFEHWDDFFFSDVNEDEFLTSRVRLHGDLRAGEHLRLFVEGKSALATDRDLPGGRRPLEVDTAALQQAFLELNVPAGEASVRVRGGRQMLLYGAQRLVSPLAWSSSMRAWDGITARVTVGDCWIEGFATQFVPVRKYEFNEADAQDELYGLYASGGIGETGVRADAYWLRRERDDLRDHRHTLGGRVHGKIAELRVDYDIEAAWQTGARARADVEAYMVGVQIGHRLADGPADPRIWVGFDYGSGDGDPADGMVETFDQLYPLGHAYLGDADHVGRQNILDLSVGAECRPIDPLKVRLAGHFFWLDDNRDALYHAGGGVLRAGAAGASEHVGSEIDLTVSYRFNRHLDVLAGYSHFFAGDFLEDTGSHDDIDFAYLQTRLLF